MSEWIDYSEHLPPLNKIVAACDVYSGFVTLGRRQFDSENENGVFLWVFMEEFEPDSVPTYWMELPERPHE